MTYLNLGILAHIDAGKTSLTEQLLFAAGVISQIGSVDAGSTQTDSLALERQRGITIKAAVVSFQIENVTVNLIDTPGHPDFIAEVERVLRVLDGAVLVVSAVEGVQAQTRVLMRVLQRLRIPTLIFVNKIDRVGADGERVLRQIAEKLTPNIIAMGAVSAPGTREAAYTPFTFSDALFRAQLLDRLSEHDDRLLAAYLRNETAIAVPQLQQALAEQAQQALLYPVLFGSAITGAGIEALMANLKALLPTAEGEADAPLAGSIFKIERGAAGEKIAYVRIFSGSIYMRQQIRFGHGHTARVTAISVFAHGSAQRCPALAAGQIAQLWGLADAQIGDMIGQSQVSGEQHFFAPPTLETLIVPCHSEDRTALYVALAQLAEQDPLINLRKGELHQELFVSLYGEVQKEVIQATLAADFRLDVAFRETTTICIERPIGIGTAVEFLGKAPNPFLATIGLRIEPAPLNSGLSFRLEVKPETIPIFIYKSAEEFQQAMEQTLRETLSQGLYGWQVTDCQMTLTHSGYTSPASSARDFRLLAPLVLMNALEQAGTVVCEPFQRFQMEIPTDSFGRITTLLAQLGAVLQAPAIHDNVYVLEGSLPAAQVHVLQQMLPGLTHGEGLLEYAFDSYQPLRGAFPARPRTDYNPRNRQEYLLHVLRRV